MGYGSVVDACSSVFVGRFFRQPYGGMSCPFWRAGIVGLVVVVVVVGVATAPPVLSHS